MLLRSTSQCVVEFVKPVQYNRSVSRSPPICAVDAGSLKSTLPIGIVHIRRSAAKPCPPLQYTLLNKKNMHTIRPNKTLVYRPGRLPAQACTLMHCSVRKMLDIFLLFCNSATHWSHFAVRLTDWTVHSSRHRLPHLLVGLDRNFPLYRLSLADGQRLPKVKYRLLPVRVLCERSRRKSHRLV